LRHRQPKGPATDRPSLNHRVTPRLYASPYLYLGILGLIVISYSGNVAERSDRASYVSISSAGTLTPFASRPRRRSTTGCTPFQVILIAHAQIQ
jgi:hypothetical protein